MSGPRVAMWASTGDRCGIASYTGALTTELEQLGASVDRVPVPYEDRDPGRFAATIERLNAAEIIHIQHEYTFWGGIAPGSSSLQRYYAHLLRPRVVTAHTVFTAAELLRVDQETRWRQRLAKRLLAALPRFRRSVEVEPFAGSRALIVHTAEARERLVARGLPAKQVHVLPAGIPRPAVVPTAEEIEAFRQRTGLEGGRLAAIFGYVTPDKGYEVALEALQALPPGIKLLIAGGARVEREAPYLDVLRAEIERQGLKNRVAITGYLEEEGVALAMAAADLVLVPHLAANGSYSVRVALGHGKPVLASNLACFREIADQGGGVELFEAGDAHSLAERTGYLMASAGSRARLADEARRFAESQSWAAVAEATLRIYRDVLAAKR